MHFHGRSSAACVRRLLFADAPSGSVAQAQVRVMPARLQLAEAVLSNVSSSPLLSAEVRRETDPPASPDRVPVSRPTLPAGGLESTKFPQNACISIQRSRLHDPFGSAGKHHFTHHLSSWSRPSGWCWTPELAAGRNRCPGAGEPNDSCRCAG